MIRTKFANNTNPFKKAEAISFVPIPVVTKRVIGAGVYDDKFQKILDFKQAIQIPLHEFNGIRTALQRYLIRNDMRAITSIRQLKDSRNSTYTLWLVNAPPEPLIHRKANK